MTKEDRIQYLLNLLERADIENDRNLAIWALEELETMEHDTARIMFARVRTELMGESVLLFYKHPLAKRFQKIASTEELIYMEAWLTYRFNLELLEIVKEFDKNDGVFHKLKGMERYGRRYLRIIILASLGMLVTLLTVNPNSLEFGLITAAMLGTGAVGAFDFGRIYHPLLEVKQQYVRSLKVERTYSLLSDRAKELSERIHSRRKDPIQRRMQDEYFGRYGVS